MKKNLSSKIAFSLLVFFLIFNSIQARASDSKLPINKPADESKIKNVNPQHLQESGGNGADDLIIQHRDHNSSRSNGDGDHLKK